MHARRNRRVYWGTHDELIACILMGAVIAGLVIGLAGGIISLMNSDDPYTRCLVTHSHDTCAYALR